MTGLLAPAIAKGTAIATVFAPWDARFLRRCPLTVPAAGEAYDVFRWLITAAWSEDREWTGRLRVCGVGAEQRRDSVDVDVCVCARVVCVRARGV